MEKINVYDFCMLCASGNKFVVDGMYVDKKGRCLVSHREYPNRFAKDLYEFYDYDVVQFEVMEDGTIKIIASKEK